MHKNENINKTIGMIDDITCIIGFLEFEKI